MVKIGMLFALASWNTSLASISDLLSKPSEIRMIALGPAGRASRRTEYVVHGNCKGIQYVRAVAIVIRLNGGDQRLVAGDRIDLR